MPNHRNLHTYTNPEHNYQHIDFGYDKYLGSDNEENQDGTLPFEAEDVIVEELSGAPQRIHELHPSYLPLQYPLLFPRGEDGYRDDIDHFADDIGCNRANKRVNLREYFVYKLMTRHDEVSTILHAGRLFQQFVVDAYTMIEAQRPPTCTHTYMASERDKIKEPEDVDKIISAEIPNPDSDPQMYELVQKYMMHSPCGPLNPKAQCMVDKRCNKFFPKKYNPHTIVDHERLPTYRRRDDGRSVDIKGIPLDNRQAKSREFVAALKEASMWAVGQSLRAMFMSMLLCCCLTRPEVVWKETSQILSEDLLHIPHRDPVSSTILISRSDKEQAALIEIETLLQKNGKSISDFPSLPMPSSSTHVNVDNHLIRQELNYNKVQLQKQSEQIVKSLNVDQQVIYNTMMSKINSGDGGFFFVYGYGGTGKTVLWNAFTSLIRSRGEIVLTVVSSGIAATLLQSGRTAHSRFAIPIAVNEDSMCNIKQNSLLADLI
ncbi:hypothetical protein K1719_047026 [Acacia pycnantha]|nr:hypothetical protein K1719_047026 [Acacia pycnantha]